MRLLDSLADRVVAAVVPKTTAAACACTPDSYWEFCFCDVKNSQYVRYTRSCSYNCNCGVYCGGCVVTGPCN